MSESSHYSQSAVGYARAIIELGEEQKLSLESIGQELAGLREVIENDETFRMYLANPTISAESRGELLKRALSGKVSPLIMHTIGVMNEKNRLSLLVDVARAYADLLDEKLGKIEVDVIVAHKLSADELQQVKERVSKAMNRDAVVHPYVDESIIGGMMLRIGDKLIDASVKSQLQSLKEKLLAARPN